MLGEWVRRLHFLVRRRAVEEDLREEMEAHRALLDDPRTFGNTLRLQEESRDAWGWRWLDDLAQDARFAVRTLRKTPGFTLTAVVTLALGIGVNSGMFSLVNSVLLRPLYDRSADVVSLTGRSLKVDRAFRQISYPNYLDIRDGTGSIFTTLAAASDEFSGVDAGDGPRRTLTYRVTADYFPLFGRPLARGRAFTPDEARPGANSRVAIVSHSFWQRRGARPEMVGETVLVNGDSFTVIGVAREGFTGTSVPGPEIWLPLSPQGAQAGRNAHILQTIGRLREGVTIESAAPTLATVAQRLEQAFPAVNGGYTLAVAPPMRLLFMPSAGGAAFTATVSLILMSMPVIVLLVACLNLADLLLARGHVRRHELAVKASLGAGRGRLVRQLLTEGAILSALGGAAGLWLSTWATRAAVAALRPILPVAQTLEIVVDWRVIVGTLVFSLMASIVFGAWPAWSLTARAATAGLRPQMGDGGRSPGGIRVGNALVIAQVALSVLLLASAGLFLTSAYAALSVDPGFRLERGVLAEVDPGLVGYDQARARAFHLALVDRLRGMQVVEFATAGSSFPFSSGDSRDVVALGGTKASAVDAVYVAVGSDYARTLGLPMLGGRDFSSPELTSSAGERVAIVDDVLAQRLWPGGNAVGQSIQFLEGEAGAASQPLRVVGIMPAVKHSLGTPRPFPHVYVPLGLYEETAMTLQVRMANGQSEPAMLAAIGRAVREADGRVPILRMRSWRHDLDSGVEAWIFRAAARVCALFGTIALLLAVIGVYGVKSYIVSRRTREFGIRIATGAHPRVLLWQVLREGGRVTLSGIAIGLVLAVGAGRILQNILYGVRSVEPLVLITAPLVLLAASLLASFFPALRATRVNPTVALRAE
jgi:predicted permease